MLVLFLGEKADQVIGHGLTDLVDIDQVVIGIALAVLCLDHRLSQGIEATEMPGQQPGCGLADLADTERIDKPVQLDIPAFINGIEQLGGRGGAPAFLVAQRGQALAVLVP